MVFVVVCYTVMCRVTRIGAAPRYVILLLCVLCCVVLWRDMIWCYELLCAIMCCVVLCIVI